MQLESHSFVKSASHVDLSTLAPSQVAPSVPLVVVINHSRLKGLLSYVLKLKEERDLFDDEV